MYDQGQQNLIKIEASSFNINITRYERSKLVTIYQDSCMTQQGQQDITKIEASSLT